MALAFRACRSKIEASTTGTRGFGMSLVSGRRRVPNPAAKIKTFRESLFKEEFSIICIKIEKGILKKINKHLQNKNSIFKVS